MRTTIYKELFQVRVSCATFNQTQYITDALNGFCMQQTSFPFVCTIFDDCSTDGEQEVIRQYLQEHFDLEDNSIVKNEETDDYMLTFARHKTNENCFFAVYYLKYNHFSIGKNIRKDDYCKEFIEQATYIAFCEGDDYWIDTLKLQKQVDYLKLHPECGLVCGYAHHLNQLTGVTVKERLNGEKDYTYDDVLWENPITTLTAMYRKNLLYGYDEFTRGKSWFVGDLPQWLFIASKSNIHKLNDVLGVYRVVTNSFSHGNSYEKRIRYINTIYDIVCFYAKKVGCKDFNRLEQRHYIELFNEAFAFKRFKTAKEVFPKIKEPNWKLCVKRIICSL